MISRILACRPWLMCCSLLLILDTCSSLFAQYPLLPPECNGNANYEWRPDLGGWRDKATNLIWGYSLTETTGSTYSYTYALSISSNYPQLLSSQVASLIQRAENNERLAPLETDPVRAQARLEFAARYRADALAASMSAADAARFTNWRIPKLQEFKTAWTKGFFTRSDIGFNYDKTAYAGYQYGWGPAFWTSEPSTNKGKLATCFFITDGGTMQTSIQSSIGFLVVRSGQ